MFAIEKTDPEVASVLRKEHQRQEFHIELIASENFTSQAVMQAQGSVLTNKYAEGYPGRRYYGGCEVVDKVEVLAIERLKELYGASYANVQPHSGSTANQSAYLAILQGGDSFLGMGLAEGGHLTHGSSVSSSGKLYNAIPYGLHPVTGLIDYDKVADLAKEHQPKLIVAGASCYTRHIDWLRFREIADSVGACFMVDMAHYAGLIAAGIYPSPVGIADVVTSTTHKTLRGPRGGFILSNSEVWAKKINSAVFPGMQGGPLMHVIAAKAVAFKEARQEAFRSYQQQVLHNARALYRRFKEHNFSLLFGGTDCHMVLISLENGPYSHLTGADVCHILGLVGIVVNKNSIPGDKRKPMETSGFRVGSAAMTTRGMRETEMVEIVDLIVKALLNHKNTTVLDQVAADVRALCQRFPLFY